LLRQPTLPLGEISFLLGYSEPSTFSRAFKRWTGVTPGEWRLETR
jgi:AraC-like DNA-binding protein